MKLIIKLLGVVDNIRKCYISYKSLNINKLIWGGRVILYPFSIVGVENIKMDENVSICANSIIFTTRAKLIIKQHFVSRPGLTIITGDHMPILGRFLDTVSEINKNTYDINHDYDQDVIIEEDVWCGANVTILKGVTIGGGSIIAASAVVTKNIPPYSIAGGAKVIKKRMSNEDIFIHEQKLYQ